MKTLKVSNPRDWQDQSSMWHTVKVFRTEVGLLRMENWQTGWWCSLEGESLVRKAESRLVCAQEAAQKLSEMFPGREF